MRVRSTGAVLLAIAALAGCGGESESDETAASTGTETAEEGAVPDPIGSEDAERVKLEDRLESELEIPDGPDWMVYAFDSLWIKRDSGAVERVDPATGKGIEIEPRDPFEPPLCQGIGASEDAIWSCPAQGDPAGTVVRIDPQTNTVESELEQRKFPDQGRIVSVADHLWLLGEDGTELTGVDLETEKASKPLALEETCTDLVAGADETTLWAMCPIEGHVLRIDAAVPEVTGEIELDGARNGSAAEDLWVGFDDGLAQIDPESLEIEAFYDVSPAFGGSVFATDEEVWAREEGGAFLTRIDPAAGRIAETIEAPDLQSGGDVIVVGDSVWASAYDDNVVVELSR